MVLTSLRDEASKYRKAGLAGLLGLAARYVAMHLRPLRALPPARDGLRVVVSLTTLPSRIRGLRPALASVLDQDRPPDEVVLALPPASRREGRDYRLPRFLDGSPVRVLRCDRDWGPATKLLPVLAAEGPETLLVVVDDDGVYPRDMLRTLVEGHRRFPGSALGFRGWRVPPTLDWHEAATRYGSALDESEEVDVVTGTWGILVQPRFFDAALFDYEGAPPGAFFVDDLWINGHLARRGVPRRLLPCRTPPLPTHLSWRNALGVRENADGRHNNALLAHFWGTR